MTEKVKIWTFPREGRVPDLAEMLQATSLTELFAASERKQEQAFQAQLEARDVAVERAQGVATDLAAKGIDVELERFLRPTLAERLSEKWYDFLDWWEGRRDPAPDDTPPPEDAMFVYDVTLAITDTVREIPVEYDEIFAEVDAMVAALSRQITAQRGRAPVTFDVPEPVIDALEEEDAWSEEATLAFELDCAVAYWPAAGQPALMLSVVQEDTDHRVEVKLLAHGGMAHRRMMAMAEEMGIKVN